MEAYLAEDNVKVEQLLKQIQDYNKEHAG